MANDFQSNITRKLLMSVVDKFEANRVLSKNVNTQTFQGSFTPNSGATVDIKRPTDYISLRTPTGDVTGQSQSIITGKASATVQDYITVLVDYNEYAQSLEMGTDMARFASDMANRIVIDLETSFSQYALQNAGLSVGTPGTGANSWSDIAEAAALMRAVGVPDNAPWCYAVNPFSQKDLAKEQRSLGVNPQVSDASSRATVAENFAGFTVKSATTLASYNTSSVSDRTGVIAALPDVTYLTHKDSMIQQISVSGFGANLSINAGETITISGRNRLNLSTRQPIVDASGGQILFTGTVVSDVTLDGSGAGVLAITGPAIYEASGAYNTVDSALQISDDVTLGGSASSVISPNLFWHRDAFAIASVKLNKLYSTDTVMQTKDGLILRASMGSELSRNSQQIRIDMLPAFGVLNPFFAGQGHGSA